MIKMHLKFSNKRQLYNNSYKSVKSKIKSFMYSVQKNKY